MEFKLNIDREARKSFNKLTVIFLSLIMIFSIGFTVISFNNAIQNSGSSSSIQSSVPEALYSKCGESVCFIGSQPVISFGMAKYPVQYDIFTVSSQSSNVATPYISGSSSPGNLSMADFNSYHTREIQNNNCTSADLVRYGNSTQAADIFFFHQYGMGSSVAFQNKLNVSAMYIVDFTMVLPGSDNFTISGDGSNTFHSFAGTSFIIGQKNTSIALGGLNINWICDSNLFHTGEIKKINGYNALILSFGPIRLSAHETYTIDPEIAPTISTGKPISRSGGGGGGSSGGGGGGCNPVTTYPPVLSGLEINQPSSTCFANGSADGHISISYEISSCTNNGPIREGYFEVTRSGTSILLGTTSAYQGDEQYFSTTVNNIGCFSGFEIAYEYPGTSTWTCQHMLGHAFNEYISDKGFEFPDLQEFPDQGKVLNSNGKIVASVSGAMLYKKYASICSQNFYQTFLSYGNEMGAINRDVCVVYSGQNSKADTNSCFLYKNLAISCVTDTTNYLPIVLATIAISATIIGVILSFGSGVLIMSIAGASGGAAIGAALAEYICYPDTTQISNQVSVSGHFKCSDSARSTAPNEPYDYFNYGCYLVSNTFNQNISIGINEIGSDQEQVDHFTYSEGFTVFNTTLTGNTCEEQQTYSATLSSPVYLLFG
jgi:hypothetical protein